MQSQREHLAAVAVLLVFTVVFFAPLLTGKTFSMVGAHMFAQYPWTGVVGRDASIIGEGYPQTDHAETFYPNSVFATNAIRSGQLPMWLPYCFGGIPLLELGLTGWLYPPRLMAMAILSPIRQHDFLLFSHLLMSALGMYALLRVWGANLLGAILGAMVWELNGHNSFWLVFEHVALAAAWLPLSMFAATQAVRKRSLKWALAGGSALGIASLSGSLHYVYLGALVLTGWFAALILTELAKLPRGRWHKSALVILSLPVCSVVVAVALSAAFWLPFTEQLPDVHRVVPTLEYQLSEAVPFNDFVSALISPRIAAGSEGRSTLFASFAYTGVLAMVFAAAAAVLAAATRRLSAPIILALIVCSLSIGFALGCKPLVICLRALLPYFGTQHPHAGFYLSGFGIAVLAAFGMTEAGRLLLRIRLPRYLLLVGGCLLVIIAAWQLIAFARTITPVHPETSEWLFPETGLIRALKGQQESYRILPVYYRDPEGKWWPPVLAGKVAAVFELRTGSGYESLLPVPTASLWRTIEQGGAPVDPPPLAYRPYFYHDRLPIDLLEKTSVGLLATPPNTVPRDVRGGDALQDGKIKEVYRGADGRIYKLNHALPRAFLVSRVVSAPDAHTALTMLADPEFDARDAAIVIGEETAAQTGLQLLESQPVSVDATAAITNDQLNNVEIDVTTPRTAMMVFNDSWAPGWKAYVDNVELPVLRVNYAFRGVVLREGKHRVVFLYRPAGLITGLCLSIGTLLLVIVSYAIVGFRALRKVCNKPCQVDTT